MAALTLHEAVPGITCRSRGQWSWARCRQFRKYEGLQRTTSKGGALYSESLGDEIAHVR
jgi:uncharacterized protein (DUF885 family)